MLAPLLLAGLLAGAPLVRPAVNPPREITPAEFGAHRAPSESGGPPVLAIVLAAGIVLAAIGLRSLAPAENGNGQPLGLVIARW